MTIITIFHHFQFFDIETDCLENEKKLECPFLVERAKIENASFSYKTTVSEAYIEWRLQKCTYHKQRTFASN